MAVVPDVQYVPEIQADLLPGSHTHSVTTSSVTKACKNYRDPLQIMHCRHTLNSQWALFIMEGLTGRTGSVLLWNLQLCFFQLFSWACFWQIFLPHLLNFWFLSASWLRLCTPGISPLEELWLQGYSPPSCVGALLWKGEDQNPWITIAHLGLQNVFHLHTNVYMLLIL